MDQSISIEQLWEQFYKAHQDDPDLQFWEDNFKLDREYLNLLMECDPDLARSEAERVHLQWSGLVLPAKDQFDDLISAGTSRLLDAIDAYDPERGVKFETYCDPRAKGSILDELRSMDWVPHLVRAQKRGLKDLLTRGLSLAERVILVLRYCKDMSMKEIGATLELSEARASLLHSSIVTRLKGRVKDPIDIYADQVPPKELIHVIQTINIEVLKHLKRHPRKVYDLEPRQFEELIAEILASFGWKVHLTKPTRDGGYDIYAITKEPKANVQTSWIIECKKYAPERKVGIDIVRKLHSVKVSMNVGCMMLATTSYFTIGVQAFKASRYDLELKNCEEIIAWINEYRPNPNGQLYLRDNKLTLLE